MPCLWPSTRIASASSTLAWASAGSPAAAESPWRSRSSTWAGGGSSVFEAGLPERRRDPIARLQGRGQGADEHLLLVALAEGVANQFGAEIGRGLGEALVVAGPAAGLVEQLEHRVDAGADRHRRDAGPTNAPPRTDREKCRHGAFPERSMTLAESRLTAAPARERANGVVPTATSSPRTS